MNRTFDLGRQRVFHAPCLALLIAFVSSGTVAAQNTAVGWYAFSNGFGTPSGTNVKAFTAIGQTFVGKAIQANTQVESGFLANGQFRGGLPITQQYAMLAGWNMISLALSVTDDSVSHLFPTATTNAFIFAGSYIPQKRLANGPGYWLKFDTAQTVAVRGTPTISDTIDVTEGWNLIGSIAVSVDTASVVDIPNGIILTAFYAFEGSYVITPTIQPGKGYWVKCAQPGSLVLHSTGAHQNTSRGTDPLATLNRLTITDAFRKEQTIYFGSNNELSKERYTLPPPPPEGAFDARLGTGGLVDLAREGETREDALLVNGAHYPLSVAWEIRQRSPASLIIGEREFELTGKGSLQVAGKQTSIRLKHSATDRQLLPTEFALHQNYPNPFNPSTTIRFDLPTQAFVTLKVFNILGQEVATLTNQLQEAGFRSVEWDASNVASGVYYSRIEAKSPGATFSKLIKMLVLK